MRLVQVDGTRLQREQPFEIKGGSVITLGALEGPYEYTVNMIGSTLLILLFSAFVFIKYSPNSVKYLSARRGHDMLTYLSHSCTQCIVFSLRSESLVHHSFLNIADNLHRLGRGTFGTVMKAFDRRSGSPVAVKVIKLEARGHNAEEEEQRRAVIKREIDLLARIQHVSGLCCVDYLHIEPGLVV